MHLPIHYLLGLDTFYPIFHKYLQQDNPSLYDSFK
jgi:hypothetical protein